MALTENGLSPADIMAMTQGDRNDNGFGGTWTWVFFLFFLLAWVAVDCSAAAAQQLRAL